MTHKILLVDDESANLRLLSRLFRSKYEVFTASSGEEALKLLAMHDVALLITDQRMPGMTGIDLLKRASSLRPHMVRIILTGYADLGALVEALNFGQIYRYLAKPWDNDDLKLTVDRAIEHFETNRSRYELELANQRLTTRLTKMTHGVARAICDAMEARDEYLYGHARRVSSYASAIGRKLGYDADFLEKLYLSAFLHDVGQIGTPDSILLNPGQLTDEQLHVVQLHPERGAKIIKWIPDMETVAAAVVHHQEHFDGSGYPGGLTGDEIPIESRIILVADSYDALTSPRSFRPAFDHDTAIERMIADRGTHFDPEVLEAFLEFTELGEIRKSIALGMYGGRVSNAPINIGDTTIDDLIAEVESEPTLALAVLAKVNFVATSKPVVSIREACRQLELDELKRLVERSTMSDSCGMNSEQLWEHSIRCAIAAELLAEHIGCLSPNEAFTLGLVHDIGEILLRTLFPEKMEQVLWFGESEDQPQREIAMFGVDHAQIGQWILERCGFPPLLTKAVQLHHDGALATDPIALLLNAANVIAHAATSSDIAKFDDGGTDWLSRLGLNRGHLARIHEQTSRALEERLAMVS